MMFGSCASCRNFGSLIQFLGITLFLKGGFTMLGRLTFVLFALALWALPNVSRACIGWSCDHEACTGWNCDGKNPCTGMGCEGQSTTQGQNRTTQPLGNSPSGSPGSNNASPNTSGSSPTNSSQNSTNSQSSGNQTQKKAPALPNVEGLQGQPPSREGWNGGRYEDSHP